MIVLYKGARGKGKTLTLVKDAFLYHLLGYKILANFGLAFGDYISSSDVLKLNRESKLFNCVLVLDEIQMFFDSRNFSKQENKDFSNFIQQIRKRNIIILCTTQYVNTVELRLRQHIDCVAYPDFDKKTGYCKVKYFDLTKLEDDLDVKQLHPAKVVFNGQEVFGMYDTFEMLK